MTKKEPRGQMPTYASGPFIRQRRDRNNGLLLIYPIDAGEKCKNPVMGFAISFPFDQDARLVEYAENSVKQLEGIFE